MQVVWRRCGGEREGEAAVAGFNVLAGAAEEKLAAAIKVANEVTLVTMRDRRLRTDVGNSTNIRYHRKPSSLSVLEM